MAKAQVEDQVEETEVEDEDEAEDTIVTPTTLATELEVSPKALRAFLRREFPRAQDQKNTSWRLSEAQVEAATKHFSNSDDEDEEGEDEA